VIPIERYIESREVTHTITELVIYLRYHSIGDDRTKNESARLSGHVKRILFAAAHDGFLTTNSEKTLLSSDRRRSLTSLSPRLPTATAGDFPLDINCLTKCMLADDSQAIVHSAAADQAKSIVNRAVDVVNPHILVAPVA
jgi:hypothetical protein